MSERLVNPDAIKTLGLQVVQSLKDARKGHIAQRRKARAEDSEVPSRFSPDIQAVLVFSGPGNYFKPLKPDQTDDQKWMRWMDHDRIRAGVAVMAEVTAARMREQGIEVTRTHPKTGEVRVGVPRLGGEVTKADIEKYGPTFVYNGVPSKWDDFLSENEALDLAMRSRSSKLPASKVFLMDEVTDATGTHPIQHTGDQVTSFFNAVRNPESPIYGVTNVALVAQDPDMIRNPFYTKLHESEHAASGFEPINFWAYTLRSRQYAEIPHTESELPRLVAYAEKGDLATEPSQFVNAPLNVPEVKPLPRER